MGNKEINDILEQLNISIQTIEYLEKNQINIIDTLLKRIENPNEFKLNIEKHFEWIIAHCNNGTSNFNDYNTVNNKYKIYCSFYKDAIKLTNKADVKISTQKNIIAYLTHIKSIFC